MSNTHYHVVCDETNNSIEDLEQGKLTIDFYVKEPYFEIKFFVDKTGKVSFKD